MVLVNPDPCCHPVTMMTGSPSLMKCFDLPKLIPVVTRASTSFNQSSNRAPANIRQAGDKNYFVVNLRSAAARFPCRDAPVALSARCE